MNAITEYQSLSSIAAKLKFNGDGRPGVSQIRDDQQRIKTKRRELKSRVSAQLTVGQFPDLRIRARNPSREQRHRAVNNFLRQHAWFRADIDAGSPGQLFNTCWGDTFSSWALPRNVHALGNGWFYKQIQDEDKSWSTYSKGWHRAHGPKISISNRCVYFRRIGADGKPECRTAHLDAWRGDWLATAVYSVGLAPEKSNIPLSIRLNKSYDAQLVAEKHGYKIYSRTLVGAHIDYVMRSPLGMTYHDADRSKLVSGLHAKIRAGARSYFTCDMIDWSLCKKLGFCDTGIKSFCADFGFDPHGKYNAATIYQTVKAHAERATPYLSELRTLAKSINFNVPEFN